MKSLAVPILVACLCIAVAASTAPADGFQWNDLNPFSKSEKTNAGYKRFREPKKNILPSVNLMPKKNSNGNGTLKKASRNTQKFFAKTADFLNPFNDGNDLPSRQPVTGSRRTYSGSSSYSSSKEKSEKGNFFANLFPKKEEAKQPGTVQEFIAQDRVIMR